LATETMEFCVHFEKQQSFDDGTVQLCIQFARNSFKAYTGLAIFVVAAYYSSANKACSRYRRV